MFLSKHNYETERISVVGEKAMASATAAAQASERRASLRVSLSLEVLWEGMSGKSEARVSDISLHGCFLEATGQVAIGERIWFQLRTPTGRWIQLNGEVVYHQIMLGFGLRFMETNAEDQGMLRQLIEFYK